MSPNEWRFSAVLRSFQLRLHLRKRLLMVRIGRNSDWSANNAVDSRERLGKDEGVPGPENPRSLYGYIKGKDGCTGHPRQMNRSRLGHIARTARTVDGERNELAVFELALQLAQRLHGAARAGSADRTEPQAIDDAGNVFAVVASAGENANPLIAENVCGWEDASVPEAEDRRTRPRLVFSAGLVSDRDAQRRPDQTYRQVACQGGQPQRESLFQGKPRRPDSIRSWVFKRIFNRRCQIPVHSSILGAAHT